MSETMELVRQEAQSVAKPTPTVADMLQAVIERGVTGDNVAAMKELVGLYERMEDRKSEKQFAQAFNALQAEMPKVHARKAVPNNDGSIRYKFAPFEDIMAQVSPLLLKHGFTVSFSQKFDESRLVIICTLQHIGGHRQSNEFAVRVGKGPPGSSDSQADGSAGTYAKRFALCNCLNIVISTDDDAQAVGETITEQQAMDLQTRVTSLGMNEASFLKLGQAKSYAEIKSAVYPVLLEVLRRKESKA